MALEFCLACLDTTRLYVFLGFSFPSVDQVVMNLHLLDIKDFEILSEER